jgi:hypothetical protein
LPGRSSKPKDDLVRGTEDTLIMLRAGYPKRQAWVP